MSCRGIILSLFFLNFFFTIFSSVNSISEVVQACMERYNGTVSSNFLLGSWYMVYSFTWTGTLLPTDQCNHIQFYRPSPEELQEYKKKYNSASLPYSFDDEAVIKNESFWKGMVMGSKMAKFYVLDPSITAVIYEGFKVTVYKPLDDKYVMQFDCEMRENIIYLLSRDRAAPKEEIEEFVKNVPQLKRLGAGQRFCAKFNNSTISSPRCRCNK